MIVIPTAGAPTEGVVHAQPDIELYVSQILMGKGTLYITQRAIIWIDVSGHRLIIPFPNMTTHAVSRNRQTFRLPCIYMMTDAELEEPFAVDTDSDEDDEESEENLGCFERKTRELYFAPRDETCLDLLCRLLCEGQVNNPDPPEQMLGEGIFLPGVEEEAEEDE